MAACEQHVSADTRPKSAFKSLKAMFFVAPIAAATALVTWSLDKQQRPAADADLASLYCAKDQAWVHTDEQVASSRAFFDTDWLPRLRDFVAVANADGDGVRLWNPLGKAWLTDEQLDLLSLAYKVGYEDGGEAHAKLLQAVLMQETIAGQLGRLGHLSAPLGKRSYGVMQVKVVAARDVLKWRPQFGEFATDEQLIARLMVDDEFNIRVASAYLKYLRRGANSDHQALVAYNLGPNAAKHVVDPAQYRYVLAVERYLSHVVMPFNGKFGEAAARTAAM